MPKTSGDKQKCPCGSGKSYSHCCGIYHKDHSLVPTAQALMRSRYSAYALGLEEYLLATWHPSTRPEKLDLASTPCHMSNKNGVREQLFLIFQRGILETIVL
jgi:uncharacterized protein YchJ